MRQASIPVREIKGIGEKTEKLLARLGIRTADQLTHHYPRCYITYPDPIPVSEVRTGIRCSIEASLDSPVHMRTTRRVKICSCLVKDGTGSLFLRWFNMPYLRNSLQQGETYIFTGIPVFKDGRMMMEQPEVMKKDKYTDQAQTLQPVYPLTAGLSSRTLRKAQKEALDMVDTGDYLPESVRAYYDLMPEGPALREIHFPVSPDRLDQARKRIIFDEFFRFFASLSLVRDREEKALNHYMIPFDDRMEAFVAGLPFSLTEAQREAIEDIRRDFSGTTAMNRLVQGDVGSGKTVVAAAAIYGVVLAGHQAALMAPTEVLARQHYETFRTFLDPYGIKTDLLTGSTRAAEKRRILQECASGEIQILIGTHAVIEKAVFFKSLALVVTDEQHRFGVRQREAFMKKGQDPHVLVMSATPIPRTLGIILYRDLDVTIIDQLPASRLPVKNSVVGQSYRPAAWRFLEKQAAAGHQAFVICPMIEENEKLELESVNSYAASLAAALPPSVHVEALTGPMPAARKQEVMDRFLANQTQILVSTTVIEVGIDVPNATVMLIENADRFGLAQLHQLRGRVGRGRAQSYCIFLSASDKEEARERLSIIGHSNNGFEIAEEDLKLRGPGDFFGTRQSGTMNFALGDIYANADIMKMASDAVDHLREEGYDFASEPAFSLDQSLGFARSI